MVSPHGQRPSVLPGMQVYAHATRSTVKKHVPHTHQKTIVKDFQLYAQEKNRGRFFRFFFFFFFYYLHVDVILIGRRNIRYLAILTIAVQVSITFRARANGCVRHKLNVGVGCIARRFL